MPYNNGRTPRGQPATIQQLADQAKANLKYTPQNGLKNWLRVAERSRKRGQDYKDEGDFESAFVEFAMAATIVLDQLPVHPEFTSLLNAEQRRNLGNVRLLSMPFSYSHVSFHTLTYLMLSRIADDCYL